jgi:hypothetical protein
VIDVRVGLDSLENDPTRLGFDLLRSKARPPSGINVSSDCTAFRLDETLLRHTRVDTLRDHAPRGCHVRGYPAGNQELSFCHPSGLRTSGARAHVDRKRPVISRVSGVDVIDALAVLAGEQLVSTDPLRCPVVSALLRQLRRLMPRLLSQLPRPQINLLLRERVLTVLLIGLHVCLHTSLTAFTDGNTCPRRA